VLVREEGVLHEEQPQAEEDQVADAAGCGVEPPGPEDPGQHHRRPEVEQRVAGAPAGDVQAVDPVVQDVDGHRDEEQPDPPLHQPQGPAVDGVAGVAVEDDQADHDGRARGVEQVRGRQVVAQPPEVPGDVPGGAEHLEQEGTEPGRGDPAQLGLRRRPAGASRRHVGAPEPPDERERRPQAGAQAARGRRDGRGGGSGMGSRLGHGRTSSGSGLAGSP
jgi:hypothetical protein